MTDTEKSNFEKLDKLSKDNPEGKINQLAYNFLKKYSEKKDVIDTLMTFETSKGLENFKEEIKKLEDLGELKENIEISNLFDDLKKLKKEISKIKEQAKYQRKHLKEQVYSSNNKEFTPNKNYDLAEQIKNQNPDLYQAITSPKGFKQQLASASFGIVNSIYKTGVGLKTLGVDVFKLLTFQVPLEQIKKQFKKV